jgi:hypothetical protein
MLRRSLVLALAALCAPQAASAAVPVPAKRCSGLTGKAVTATPEAKVVSRRIDDKPKTRKGVYGDEFVGRAFYGCALPNGRVREIARDGKRYYYVNGRRKPRGRIYGFDRAKVSRPRGTYVVVRSGSTLGQQVAENSTEVVDLATGRSRFAWYALDDGQSPIDPGPYCDTSPPLALVLEASGLFAVVHEDVDDDGKTVHAVEAFTAAGEQKALDLAPEADLPAASLALENGVVTWTHAGEPRSVAVTDATSAVAPGLPRRHCSS